MQEVLFLFSYISKPSQIQIDWEKTMHIFIGNEKDRKKNYTR
jgi:hypothetical protein